MLDKVLRMGMLLDCYASFLTNVQREQCRLHFEEDYSLTEIAEMYNISRQAVHDAINRSETSLNELEKKLGLVEKSRKLNVLQDKLSQLIVDNEGLDGEIKEDLNAIKDSLIELIDDFSGRSDLE